jgi:hypothetical protein
MATVRAAPSVRHRLDIARWWIWGLPISFLVHDGEEAIFIVNEGGLFRDGELILTTSQALAAMGLELTGLSLLALAAARAARPGWAVRAFTVMLAAWTLHGLAHLASGVAADGYALGVVTAVPACLAYGVLALHRLLADGLIDQRWLIGALVGGAALAPPLLMLVHAFGRLVA